MHTNHLIDSFLRIIDQILINFYEAEENTIQKVVKFMDNNGSTMVAIIWGVPI